MSATASIPTVFAAGESLDQIDWLRDSSSLVNDLNALQRRMREDGYLYLPGLLNREEVLAARREVANRLAALGLLDPAAPPMDCVVAENRPRSYMPEVLSKDNEALAKVLYAGPMIEFFEGFFG